jgi:hypothetical protein
MGLSRGALTPDRLIDQLCQSSRLLGSTTNLSAASCCSQRTGQPGLVATVDALLLVQAQS